MKGVGDPLDGVGDTIDGAGDSVKSPNQRDPEISVDTGDEETRGKDCIRLIRRHSQVVTPSRIVASANCDIVTPQIVAESYQ